MNINYQLVGKFETEGHPGSYTQFTPTQGWIWGVQLDTPVPQCPIYLHEFVFFHAKLELVGLVGLAAL